MCGGAASLHGVRAGDGGVSGSVYGSAGVCGPL